MDIVERLRDFKTEDVDLLFLKNDAALEIERLREALKYYADPNRYESQWDNQFKRWVPNHDHGAKAFSALQQKENE